jgi:hypothetical protein
MPTYTFEHAEPQFLLTFFNVGTSGSQKFMMVYTGDLRVFHGAEDDLAFLDVKYPLLAWAKNPQQQDSVAIFPFSDPDLMESAVAMAAHSTFHIKDTTGVCSVKNVRADIRKVGIRKSQQGVFVTQFINALVLSASLISVESLVENIQYSVTVIGNVRGDKIPDPILLSEDWTGEYDQIGTVLKRGNPRQ